MRRGSVEKEKTECELSRTSIANTNAEQTHVMVCRIDVLPIPTPSTCASPSELMTYSTTTTGYSRREESIRPNAPRALLGRKLECIVLTGTWREHVARIERLFALPASEGKGVRLWEGAVNAWAASAHGVSRDHSESLQPRYDVSGRVKR